MLSNFKIVLVRHTAFNCQRIVSTSLKVPYSTNVIRSFCKVENSFRVERYLRHLSNYNDPKYRQKLDKTLITHSIDNEVFKRAKTVEEVLDSVEDIRIPQESLHILLKLYDLKTKISSSQDEDTERLEFIHDMTSHECYPLLVENLDKVIENLDSSSAAILFRLLVNLQFQMKSPLMNKLFVKIRRQFDVINLESLTNFISGLYDYNQTNLGVVEPVTYEEFSSVTIVGSRQFRPIFERYKSLVDSLETARDVDAMAFCTDFMGGLLSIEKLNYFLQKYLDLLSQGTLNPKKASTPQELEDILDCSIRIASLRLKFRHYFLSDSHAVVECMQNLRSYLDMLSTTQKVILARVLMRVGRPPELFNDLVKSIKEIVQDPSESSEDALFILSKLGLTSTSNADFADHVQADIGEPVDHNIGYMLTILSRTMDDQAIESYLQDIIDSTSDISTLTTIASIYLSASQKNQKFDQDMSKIFLQHISNSPAITKMNQFVAQVGFIIHRNKLRTPNWVIHKFLDMVPQMDSWQLSTICDLSPNENIPLKIRNKYLITCLSRMMDLIQATLDEKDLDLVTYFKLLRLVLRMSPYCDEHTLDFVKNSGFLQLATKVPKSPEGYRMLALAFAKRYYSASYSLQMNQVLEHVIDYGISEKENLPVFFYHAVGLQTMRLQEDQQTIRMQEYEIPKEKMDELYAITNKVFIRDFDSFSGRNAVFLARILALKKHLPLEIVNKIFNEEFVKQVENYRFFYNNKPMVTFHKSLQRLNQIVCIEYPEYGLPWYYEEFNKFANKHKQAPEVDAMLYCDLLSLLGEKPQLIRETVQSPLWNLIHFELAYNTLTDEFCDITDYDDSSKVYKKSTINETPEHVQHIAVLAYSTRRYDRNDHTRRIFLNYSINHLKKEGFKVIEISPFKVGRMSMADTEDRLKYLQNLFEEQNIRLPVDKKKGILET